MCIQSLGVIIYSLKRKKSIDRSGDEDQQFATPLGPLKKTAPEGVLATDAKVLDNGGTQQYRGATTE